ncbi:MAG: hypothetical protein CVT77_03465 [Alphaproteobacteria bacterium HGW-Alphaproteobacteria-16]|nr:MAG: hypothetical protein CVT77_03465 [Alphaproteobacteria bacterium HGW-Alphaproteobacteria-16]
MSRAEHIQLNVRSAFARARAQELARLTGMTATQVVEDALRGYVPPGTTATVGKLVKRGPILVRPSGGAKVSLEDANAALEAVRERDD